MTPPEHTTPAPLGPTLGEISRWHEHLRQVHARLRPHFARPEAHQHALRYLQAVLSDLPRKNGWQIAEQARQARGNLGPTSTDFEGLCKKSASIIGIDGSEPGKSALYRVY